MALKATEEEVAAEGSLNLFWKKTCPTMPKMTPRNKLAKAANANIILSSESHLVGVGEGVAVAVALGVEEDFGVGELVAAAVG